MRELKRDELANKLPDIWIEANKENLSDTDVDEAAFGLPVDHILKEKIIAVLSETRRLPSLKEVLEKVAEDKGWSKIDEEVLTNTTTEEFYTFFHTIKDRRLHSYVKACLRFGGFSNATHQQVQIAENTRVAMRKLAAESQLNLVRVQGYGIKPTGDISTD